MTDFNMRANFYPESTFGGFTRVDGTVAFYLRVQALAENAQTLLDIGCGRGAHIEDSVSVRKRLRDLRCTGRRVIGVDVDPGAAGNGFIDEFLPLEGDRWPLADSSVDLGFADCVLEHIPNPDLFFSEARRVLKPGAALCIRTTNAWSYVAMIARLVPNTLHARVLRRAQRNRQERDVFPTVYKCNTIPQIRRAFGRHRFSGVVYGHQAEPTYFDFTKWAYLLGVTYQRVAPSHFAPTLLAFARAI